LFYLLEEEKGWEPLNCKLLGKGLLLSGINLSEWVRWLILGEDSSSSRVFWGKLLAVTTKTIG
jgi:hypothetical protein